MYRLCPRLLTAVRHLIAETSGPPTGIYAGTYVSMIIIRLPSRQWWHRYRNVGTAS